MATLFQAFCDKWRHGCGSTLCGHGTKVVLCRGQLPCDALFIGEAPGESENAAGRPFWGPAGKLLDWVIARATAAFQVPGTTGTRYNALRLAFTNLVCCIPRDEEGRKTAEPAPEEVVACSTRLEEFVALASPRLIVCVGGLAEAWIMGTKGKRHLLRGCEAKTVAIVHPGATLKPGVSDAQKQSMLNRAAVMLRSAFEDLLVKEDV